MNILTYGDVLVFYPRKAVKNIIMKKIFRYILGVIVVLPFTMATWVLSCFIGKQRAIEKIGPIATQVAKQTLKFWVPQISSPEDFDSFATKMKKKFWMWRLFYTIQIAEDTNDVFKLHVSNCPFCEILNSFGLSSLSAYVCDGDWAIARENADKWVFERNHQIGTGDIFCDHTYKRKP